VVPGIAEQGGDTVRDGALEIEVRADGFEMTLALAGELDIGSAGTLRACLESIDDGFRRVILDLTALTFIDSTGVGLIGETRRRFEPEMRDLVLHNPQGHVAKVVEITGLHTVLSVTDDATTPPAAAAAVL
jgi:anti-anti-sigma factor